VAEGREVVARQEALLERLEDAGQDTREAEAILTEFRKTLVIFEDDLRRLETEKRSASTS
jgi:hypothetical protein